MEPFEVMVSESQERMLCVVEPDRLDAVLARCARWEVRATAIGAVTGSGRLRVLDGPEVVGDVPVVALVDECPLYDLAPVAPAAPLYPAPTATLTGDDPRDALLALLACPNLSSRRPLFQQYDSIVQSRTVRRPEQADAAVLALEGGGAIAVSIDGSGRRVACDPHAGAMEAVFECAANLACAGAEPLGLTNCLNFGNPEKPHIAWQLERAVDGLAEACRALDVPVVGGNVSLYNEGTEGPIYPTPVVGMVGALPDPERAGRLGFAREGDAIAIAGEFHPALPGGELAKLRGEPLPDGLPGFDAANVRAAQAAVRDAVRAGELSSAHDIAEGGLLVAVAESCLAGGIGAALDLGPSDDPCTHLYGEGAGGFVVSGPRAALDGLAERVPLDVLGTVGGDGLEVAIGEWHFAAGLSELREANSALVALFP
jgi:phosphoribosylformylglycinamidine synthase